MRYSQYTMDQILDMEISKEERGYGSSINVRPSWRNNYLVEVNVLDVLVECEEWFLDNTWCPFRSVVLGGTSRDPWWVEIVNPWYVEEEEEDMLLIVGDPGDNHTEAQASEWEARIQF